MLIIVPSRGRPNNAADLIRAFNKTRDLAQLIIVIDSDDPTGWQYREISLPSWAKIETMPWSGLMSGGMVPSLNWAVARVLESETLHSCIGFMGDDHRPRTRGWDTMFMEAIGSMHGGIAFGNDLLQGPNLPTHVVMDMRIVRALGFMCPPTFYHLYVDNYWKALGQGIGRFTYLPNVTIEHMHPIAGKAEWDAGYKRVNAGDVYARDEAAFNQWDLAADIARVKEALT